MQVIIGNPELKANHNITQIVEVVAEHEKYPRLINLLKQVCAGGRGFGGGALGLGGCWGVLRGAGRFWGRWGLRVTLRVISLLKQVCAGGCLWGGRGRVVWGRWEVGGGRRGWSARSSGCGSLGVEGRVVGVGGRRGLLVVVGRTSVVMGVVD